MNRFDARAERHAAMRALRHAAAEARRVAIQTGTAIIVRRNGKTVRVTAEELLAEDAAAKAATTADSPSTPID